MAKPSVLIILLTATYVCHHYKGNALLCFYAKDGYANVLRCHITCTLPVLWNDFFLNSAPVHMTFVVLPLSSSCALSLFGSRLSFFYFINFWLITGIYLLQFIHLIFVVRLPYVFFIVVSISCFPPVYANRHSYAISICESPGDGSNFWTYCSKFLLLEFSSRVLFKNKNRIFDWKGAFWCIAYNHQYKLSFISVLLCLLYSSESLLTSGNKYNVICIHYSLLYVNYLFRISIPHIHK